MAETITPAPDTTIASKLKVIKQLLCDEESVELEAVKTEEDLKARACQNLPIEVLQHIFTLVRDAGLERTSDHTRYFTTNSLTPTAAPWNVSQVSTLWRQAALGHSLLWSHIGIVVTRTTCTESLGHLLSAQLTRASSSPLVVSLSTLHLPSSLTEMLSNTSAHWKHFRANCSNTEIFRELAAFRPSFSSLESLEVWVASLSPLSSNAVTPFRLAAKLTELYGDVESMAILGAFPSVTRIGILSPAPQYAEPLQQLLLSHPLLQELTLEIVVPFNVMASFETALTLPHLRQLILHTLPSGCRFLRILATPNLQELNVSLNTETSDLKNILNAFIEQSRCSLHSLTMNIHEDNYDREFAIPHPQNILHTLELCSSLRKLTLQDNSGPRFQAGVQALRSRLLGLSAPRFDPSGLHEQLVHAFGTAIARHIVDSTVATDKQNSLPPARANDPDFLPMLESFCIVNGQQDDSELTEEFISLLSELRPSWNVYRAQA